jgi:hypothetical protein
MGYIDIDLEEEETRPAVTGISFTFHFLLYFPRGAGPD